VTDEEMIDKQMSDLGFKAMYEAFNDSVRESPDDGASYDEGGSFSEAEFCCCSVSNKVFKGNPKILFQFFFV